MAKYKAQLVQEMESWIAEHGLLEYGGAKLKEFLAVFHIDWKTYKHWYDTKREFKEAVDRAKEAFKSKLSIDLSITLADSARGGYREEEEESTEYRPNPANPSQPTIARMTKTKRKKYIKPDVAAAIFLLTNLDPDHYQNRRNADITLKQDDDRPMTIDEIDKELERLAKLDSKQ